MGMFAGFVDSFRTDPNATGASFDPHSHTSNHSDGEKASGDVEKASVSADAYKIKQEGNVVVNEKGMKMTTEDSGLQRKLQSRHMQMIAFGEFASRPTTSF